MKRAFAVLPVSSPNYFLIPAKDKVQLYLVVLRAHQCGVAAIPLSHQIELLCANVVDAEYPTVVCKGVLVGLRVLCAYITPITFAVSVDEAHGIYVCQCAGA